MSSGRVHNASIAFFTPVVALASLYEFYLIAPDKSLDKALLFTGAYLFSGYWLSPDIDMKQSFPSQLWSILSVFWQPYRKASGHRGFSHCVFFGSLSRFLYLGVLVCFPLYFVMGLDILDLAWQHKEKLVLFFIAMEVSALVHLFFDYIVVIKR